MMSFLENIMEHNITRYIGVLTPRLYVMRVYGRMACRGSVFEAEKEPGMAKR